MCKLPVEPTELHERELEAATWRCQHCAVPALHCLTMLPPHDGVTSPHVQTTSGACGGWRERS